LGPRTPSNPSGARAPGIRVGVLLGGPTPSKSPNPNGAFAWGTGLKLGRGNCPNPSHKVIFQAISKQYFNFLNKMCSQRYFIQYTLLIFAINSLLALFNITCKSSDDLLIKLNKNYIFYNKNITKIDPNYSKILQIY